MLSLQATVLSHQPGDPYESPNENEDFIWMTYWMDNYVHFYYYVWSDGSLHFNVWCRCLKKGCSPFVPFRMRFGTLTFSFPWTVGTGFDNFNTSIGNWNKYNRGHIYKIRNESFEHFTSKGIETLPYFDLIWAGNGRCNWGLGNTHTSFTVPSIFMPKRDKFIGKKLKLKPNHRQVKDVRWTGHYADFIGTWGIHDTAGGQEFGSYSAISYSV